MAKSKDERTFNMFEHVLAPQHERIPKDDPRFNEILEKYHIRPYQLPYIKSDDPACRAIDAQPGDIVIITRRSNTAGEAIFYRYVV